MKFERFLLSLLMVGCITVATLIMAAMLSVRPGAMPSLGGAPLASTLLAAPVSCALKLDDVVCPRQGG